MNSVNPVMDLLNAGWCMVSTKLAQSAVNIVFYEEPPDFIWLAPDGMVFFGLTEAYQHFSGH